MLRHIIRSLFVGAIVLGLTAAASAAPILIQNGGLAVQISDTSGAIFSVSFEGTEFYRVDALVGDHMYQIGENTGSFTIFRMNETVGGGPAVVVSPFGVPTATSFSALSVDATNGIDVLRTYEVISGDTLSVTTTVTATDGRKDIRFADTFDPDHGVAFGLGNETTNDIDAAGEWASASIANGLTSMIGGVMMDDDLLSFGTGDTAFGLGINNGGELNDFFENAPVDPDGAVQDIGYSIGFEFELAEGDSTTFTYFHKFSAGADVPEPTSVALVGLGLLGLGALRRRKS